MRLRLAPWLVAAAATIAPTVARAAPSDDVARADRLFKEAKEQLVHGMTADACASFAESKRLAPGVGVTLYLADCYQRIGRTASAWAEFRSAEALARDHKDKRAELARRRAQALASKLTRLTIRVTGPRPAAAAPLRISYDGAPVPPEDWDAALPVDPGEHVVVARAGAWEHTIGVHVDAATPSTTVSVELPPPPEQQAEAPPASPVPAPGEAAAATPSQPAAPPPVEQSGSELPALGSDRFWIAAGLGGVGVAGVGLGAVFGALAVSRRNQSNAGPCDAADTCTPAGLSLRHDALADATVSTVGFVAGLAALGAGAVVYFLLPASSPGGAVTVAPAPVAGGACAVLRTSF